jgi:3-hydroxy-3-methylglutaryl-CoA-synthase
MQDDRYRCLHASTAFRDAMIDLCAHAAGADHFDKAVKVVGIDQLQRFQTTEMHSGWVYATCVRYELRCSVVDVVLFDTNMDPVLLMTGVRLLHKRKLPPPVLAGSQTPYSPAHVGILAMEYYCPNLCVRAQDIEDLQGRPKQYTVGRGQENLTFCSDDEDAVSMAMTAFDRLMDRCELGYSEIGRLEVGTECQVDRAKSIKSFLMEFFARDGLCNVEGADTYNACYGGTNALFNAVNWVQSDAWNGKYAVVICTDTAVHSHPDQLQSMGASALALLVGPQAPLVLETQRVSFMKHAWDFYRPIGWHNNDAIVDIDMATAQYEEALLWCQKEFVKKMGADDLLSSYGFVVFHCNAPYHAKRSMRVMCNSMYGRELSREEHDALYESHVEAGTSISAQNVSSFLPLKTTMYALSVP